MKELNSTTPSHKSDYDIFRFPAGNIENPVVLAE